MRASANAAAALVAWTALVVWLTWPLTKQIDRALPWLSGPDALYSMWALAWQCHALATDPARLFDANIYHPAPRALLYGPTGMGALPLFGPAYALSGSPVVATNVLLMGGTALTAWTIGLVAARWTRSAAAGAVAGATYLSTPWVLINWQPACPHFAMLFWFPLIIERASRPLLRSRDALVLGALIALQGAVEIVYIAPAVLAPLAVVAVVRLSRARTRRSGMLLCGALATGAMILAPLLIAHAAVRSANPDLAVQTPWPDTFGSAPFPWGLFGWPSILFSAAPTPPLSVPALAFVLIACGIASVAIRRGAGDPVAARGWRHAGLWTLTGVALGLPPQIQMFGTVVALPHRWLWAIVPAIRVVRVPARLGVAGLMGLCLLAGLAFDEIARRLFRRWEMQRAANLAWGSTASAVVLALVAYGPAAEGYKLRPVRASTPYASILRAGRGPLLEIGYDPALRRHIRSESAAMFRSMDHWRPLLNGYASYWPREYMQMQRLAARLPEDIGALEILRKKTGVELILVWPRVLRPRKRAAWFAIAAQRHHSSLALVGRGEQDALLFRVEELRASR